MSDTKAASYQTQSQSQSDPIAHVLRGYQTEPGVADELKDSAGALRPVWSDFVRHLASLPADGVADRFRRGNQYLRDAGVFYRKYGADSADERDWPLSHIPVLLRGQDWDAIASGLVQRAELLEQIVADLYGPANLIRDGHLPASVVAQNPGWLRPMVGVKPPSGAFLNFLAFEVGRGPSGQWWVLGDRTDAPSGAGFALENRVATSRVFPNFYGQSNTRRLARFFQAFRDRLQNLRTDKSEPIGLLTPGQMNDGFFEHAYLARYLGFLLVEGEDLTVADGHLKVRTVEGLKPISVLWRRLDAEFCDPLELNEASALGTPGMLDAIRRGNLSTINTPGAGVLESRSLMAFLPQLCEALTGAPLQLPNVATWWCGQPEERAQVLAQRDRIRFASAFTARTAFNEDAPPPDVPADPQALKAFLETHGASLVGQETVRLSTTPVWENGGLVPRAMTLRIFLARTEHGWQAMPGGYARIGANRDATVLGMQSGGSVADVWVMNAKDEAALSVPTLLTAAAPAGPQHIALPSRSADNLMWLGRNIERSEAAMRAFRAYFSLRNTGVGQNDPLAVMIQRDLLLSQSSDAPMLARAFEAPLEMAGVCAARTRDRFSVDGMLALKDIALMAKDLSAAKIAQDEIPYEIGPLLRKLSGFSGLVHENMYRSTAWRFLSIGLSIERAVSMTTVLAEALKPGAPEGTLDLALELGDSVMSHRARYASWPSPATVCNLLALDPRNHRSILYHVTRAQMHIASLPPPPNPAVSSQSMVLALERQISEDLPSDLTSNAMLDLRGQIWALADQLGTDYLK